jgi:hypothetical protein
MSGHGLSSFETPAFGGLLRMTKIDRARFSKNNFKTARNKIALSRLATSGAAAARAAATTAVPARCQPVLRTDDRCFIILRGWPLLCFYS